MLDPTPLIIVSIMCAIISLCSAIVGIIKGRDTKLSKKPSEKIEVNSETWEQKTSDSL